MSNFSFSLSVFYPFGYISVISITNGNLRLQTLSVWKCQKFVVWKGLRNKLYLVHLKSHVKYKSDIKQPTCGYIKASRGLCKITLRNTTHVSDKAAYRNYQIRLLSEISVTIRTLAETEKNMIGVLKTVKRTKSLFFQIIKTYMKLKSNK